MSGRSSWDSHLVAAQEEDLRFLLDAGVPESEAYRRVGLTPTALEKRERDRRRVRGAER